MIDTVLDPKNAQQAVRWEMPDFGAGVPGMAHPQPAMRDRPPTVQEIEELRAAAQAEGHEQGLQEGLAEGRQRVDAEVQRLRALIDGFAQPLADLDAEVERALVGLAAQLATRVARRELSLDPDLFAKLVHETIAAVPGAPRDVIVRVHPDLLADLALRIDPGPSWQLLADAGLEPGDVQVQADAVHIDARVSTRIDSLARNLQHSD